MSTTRVNIIFLSKFIHLDHLHNWVTKKGMNVTQKSFMILTLGTYMIKFFAGESKLDHFIVINIISADQKRYSLPKIVFKLTTRRLKGFCKRFINFHFLRFGVEAKI